MKKLYICLSVVLTITLTSCPLRAAALAVSETSEQSPLLITEMQPGMPDSASKEFIELYNTSTAPVDLDAGRWRIEVASSTATNWLSPTRTIQLTGVLAPGHTYIVASKYTNKGAPVQYLPDVMSASFSAGISATAGHVRLVYMTNDANGSVCNDTIHVADVVEWSWLRSDTPDTPVAPSIDGRGGVFIVDASGINSTLSLQRTIDVTIHQYADTDNDNTDFALAAPTMGEAPELVSTTSAPLSDTCPATPDPSPVPSEPPLPPADNGSDGDEEPGNDGEQIPDPPASPSLLAPTITELLPNPASPHTDSADEFIELYNPNDAVLDVSSFVLEVGLTTKHRYTLPAGTILAPKSWTPFYSAVTGLSMANDGGQALLYDATGLIIATADAYGTAPDGQAWMYDGSTWRWTTTPTPAAQNVATAPLPPQKKTSTTTATVKKTTAVKAATTAKTTKPATAKTPKAAKPAKTTSTAFTPVAAAARNPLHTGVLAAVGIFAISYGAYEYRSDIANKFHRLRNYRATRRSNRAGLARRRNN
ncbi:MAG: lamin tail domain-containing protein [Candidatus Saccharimonadales bacterium]